MIYTYILYSKKLNRFYVGATGDVDQRLEQHNHAHYPDNFTVKGIPWELFHTIECQDWHQALCIERHIKKMKSKKYIQNFRKYSELSDTLLQRFPPQPDC